MSEMETDYRSPVVGFREGGIVPAGDGPLGMGTNFGALGLRFCAGGCGAAIDAKHVFCVECLLIDLDMENRRNAAESTRDAHRKPLAEAVFDEIVPDDHISFARGTVIALCSATGLWVACWIGWEALKVVIGFGLVEPMIRLLFWVAVCLGQLGTVWDVWTHCGAFAGANVTVLAFYFSVHVLNEEWDNLQTKRRRERRCA
jgi:hypothetical protein